MKFLKGMPLGLQRTQLDGLLDPLSEPNQVPKERLLTLKAPTYNL